MIGYRFYSKFDPSKETINTTRSASSLTEAIKQFSDIKKLPVEEFSKLYTVEKNNGS